MAHYLDTEGMQTKGGFETNANISGTHDNDELSPITQWLSKHKLDSLNSHFQKRRISIADIRLLQSTDIEAFCEELKNEPHIVFGVFESKRLKAAIDQLQHDNTDDKKQQKQQSIDKTSLDKQQSYHLISVEEQNALNKLKKRKEAIANSKNKINKSIKEIENNTTQCNKRINDTLQTLMKALNLRKDILLKQLNEIQCEKIDALNQQKNVLCQYGKDVDKYYTECNELMHTEMDVTVRSEQISTKSKEILQQNKALRINKGKSFHFKRSKACMNGILKQIQQFGYMYSSDVPLPPKVQILRIGFNDVDVEIELEHDADDEKDKVHDNVPILIEYIEDVQSDKGKWKIKSIYSQGKLVQKCNIASLSDNCHYSMRASVKNMNGWSNPSSVISCSTHCISVDSSVMDKEDIANLCNLFSGKFGQMERVKFELLYRASKHGFEYQSFHTQCDNVIAPTVVVMKSQFGYVFGGFTRIPWSSDGAFHEDASAFLFSLKGGDASPEIFDILSDQRQYAVHHGSQAGPRFGYGYDVRIYSDCNTHDSSFIRCKHTYNLVGNALCGGEKQKHGSTYFNFVVDDYEVFQMNL